MERVALLRSEPSIGLGAAPVWPPTLVALVVQKGPSWAQIGVRLEH